MKYGFIADIHLSISDSLSPLDSDTGLSIRTHDKLDALHEALSISVSQNCEAFFICGDIYEKLNPPEKLKEAFLRTIIPFSKEIKIIIFPGNHDGADFTNNYLSELAILEDLKDPPFKIIDEPTTLYLNNGRDKFLVYPWNADHDKIVRDLEQYEEGLILVGHMEIIGATTSTEYHLTKGIHQGILQKFKYVILGHYHKHQRLARNLLYVGSPIIKDMSEIHDKNKGFIIYDSNSNNFEFYQLEKRRGFLYKLIDGNFDEVQAQIDADPPKEGDLIELEFFGTKEWINSVKGQVHKVLKEEYNPLKIKSKRSYIKSENIKAQSILSIKNRVERIKEFSKNEPEFTDLGIEIYRDSENDYLEVKV